MNGKHLRPAAFACALLLALVGFASSAAAQITVYTDINYSGASQTFHNDVPDLVALGMNDTISSFQIANGEVWQFCQDVNYQGRCQNLRGSVSDLRTLNWNDKISSMRRVDVEPRNRGLLGGIFSRNRDVTGTSGYGDGVIVYDNPNFRGASRTFNSDVPDLRDYGLNDRITSIEIPNGESWEVCQDINFEGPCTVLSGGVADLRSMGWNDRISSLRRVNGYNDRRYSDNRRNSDGYYGQQGLIFYDQPNFRGSSTMVSRNTANAGIPADWGSVRVRGGGVWRVCDEWGDCATIDRDVPSIDELGLGDRITSVRMLNASQSRRYDRDNRYRYYR